MKLLLDTQCWLWIFLDPNRLSAAAISAIENETNEVFVSAAVAWEIVIKNRIGKLPLPIDGPDYVVERLEVTGHQPLAITIDHVRAVGKLPNLHRDPFDRVLVAQALEENMTLVTADKLVAADDVPHLWAQS